MIPTDNHSSRFGERVRLITIHTTEGARTVESLGAFFQRITYASYHGAVDDHRYEAFVPYSRAAWAILNGNQESDNLALCAFASWSREEWLRHPRMLQLAGAWIADRCMARGVPLRRLTPTATAEAMADDNHPGGVIDHDDYSDGTGDGDHWDVGENFPWDVVLGHAQRILGALPAPRSSRRRRDEDNTMELPPATGDVRHDKQIPTDVVGGWCGAANLLLTANGGGAHTYWVTAFIDRGQDPPHTHQLLGDARLVQFWPFKVSLPPGTTSVVVNYDDAPGGIVARIEYER